MSVLLFDQQLSLMVKMIPSPDWFVGVDSLNLCEGSQWKQEVTIDLQPYDAGTDSGFTFSSPNFPTIPQENITKVSAQAQNPESLQTLTHSFGHFRFHFTVRRCKVAGACLSLKIG